MKIKLKIAWGEKSDQILMRMAGWSAAGHLVALIVFSLLPRFSRPIETPRATIAEIVPASALFPSAPSGAAAAPSPVTPEQSPSQRAEAAKEAALPKLPPKPPVKHPEKKEEPRIPSMKKSAPEAPRTKAPARQEPEEQEPEEPSPPAHAPGGGSGSPGSAPGAAISFGGGTGAGGIPSIGSSAFPYEYYRSSLAAILQSNWRRPVAPEGLDKTITCRIQFTILKSGIIQDPRVAQTSGNESLDQSALRAVYNSNPLPPLPFQYAQASVSAEVVFELTPD